MGASKAALEWHGSTLLRRVTGIVARAVEGPVVVVRAPRQSLPTLGPEIEVVDDAREGRGPLQGLAAGLAAVADRVDAAYVSATDAPFLQPAFVRRVATGLDDGADVALPYVGGRAQPLAAAYRVTALDLARELLAAGRLRLACLVDERAVARLDEAALLTDPALAAADPELDSVLNLNTPADYRSARARPAPAVVVRAHRAEAGTARTRSLAVRAATVGAAAQAVGVSLDAQVLPALNGERIRVDPELPLVDGDALALRSADAGRLSP